MSNKQSKKFRQLVRKQTDKLSQGIIGRATFQIARQRDVFFLVMIGQWVAIIGLILWRVLF